MNLDCSSWKEKVKVGFAPRVWIAWWNKIKWTRWNDTKRKLRSNNDCKLEDSFFAKMSMQNPAVLNDLLPK